MPKNYSNRGNVQQPSAAVITKGLRDIKRSQKRFGLRLKSCAATGECRRLIDEIESGIAQCVSIEAQTDAIADLGVVQRRLAAVLRDLPTPKPRK